MYGYNILYIKKISIYIHYTLLITRVKPTLTQITRYWHAGYSQTPLSLRPTHADIRLYLWYDYRTTSLSFRCNHVGI